MIKFIIIGVVLVLGYGIFLGLAKAAGKETPHMPDEEENFEES
jgi:hypothetical protein